jgi:hypothetical protein
MDKRTLEINCITFLWGNYPYNSVYVNRLFNMIDRHLTIPHRNICFTNTPNGIDKRINIIPLHSEWMYKNLKKAIQFDQSNPIDGRILSFDLDNVIISNIDHYAREKSKFIICEAVSQKRKGKSGGNFMAFNSNSMNYIWDELTTNYDYYEKKTQGYERFLFDLLIEEMDFWPKGEIISYRHQFKQGKFEDLSKVKMIWCHGNPQLHEMTDSIVKDNWK